MEEFSRAGNWSSDIPISLTEPWRNFALAFVFAFALMHTKSCAEKWFMVDGSIFKSRQFVIDLGAIRNPKPERP